MEQQIIDYAVALATKLALGGDPVDRIVHIPCRSATEDPLGSFVVIPDQRDSIIDTPSWEKY